MSSVPSDAAFYVFNRALAHHAPIILPVFAVILGFFPSRTAIKQLTQFDSYACS
jgi:hypothetical protein